MNYDILDLDMEVVLEKRKTYIINNYKYPNILIVPTPELKLYGMNIKFEDNIKDCRVDYVLQNME